MGAHCFPPHQLSLWGHGQWYVLNKDEWIARGTLTGHRQHNDQAELEAIRVALDISVPFPGEVCIWSDSAYASTGLHRILVNDQDIPEDQGDGRWTAIQALVRMRNGPTAVQHISAHREAWSETDPVDEWTAFWNTRADREAGRAHQMRGSGFFQTREALLDDLDLQEKRLSALHQLHFDVSEHRLQAEVCEDQGDDFEATMRDWWQSRKLHADGGWIRDIGHNWLAHLPSSSLAKDFGMKFTRAVLCWLCEQADTDDALDIRCSWLELALFWLSELSGHLPVPAANGGWQESSTVSGAKGHKHTVAATMHLFRRFFHVVGHCFGIDLPTCGNLSLLPFSVHPPQLGLHLALSQSMLHRAHEVLRNFVRHRPIRVVNDLSRPLR